CRFFTFVTSVQPQVQEHGIEHECDECPGFFRIPAPESAPCYLSPDCCKEDASKSKQWETYDDRAVPDFIHQVQISSACKRLDESEQPFSQYQTQYAIYSKPEYDRSEERRVGKNRECRKTT